MDSRDQGAIDVAQMRRALALAARGWGQTAPNPMVGAVLVRDGQVVGEGWHERFGEAHAEVNALRAAGELARGATLYVTLEPCGHQGKTPPCADALLAAGVRRVVIGAADPGPHAAGGAERLRAAGVEVVMGIEERAARALDPPFFHAVGATRPWVTLKLALSIDGALADHARSPGWLTGPETRAEVHRLRAGHDAVAVGIGTVLTDDPLLTVRGVPAPRVAPLRVVFDRTARLPLDSRLVRTAREVHTLVVAECADEKRARSLREAGVEVLESGSLPEAMPELLRRGVRALFVEGGAGVVGALLGHQMVDRLVIFQAPLLLGAGAVSAFASAPAALVGEARRFEIVERRAFGDDFMTVYSLRTP